MLKLTESGEIRLEKTLENGKKKTFIQTKVPLRESIRYSKEEGALFEKAVKDGVGVTELDLEILRYEFLAGIFDDEEVTYDLIVDELDCNEKDLIEKIIKERVMNQKTETNEHAVKNEKK